MKNLLEAQKEYAKRGWKTFPVKGKIPLTGTRGVKDAVLKGSDFTGADGIALATGSASGVVVLDVDPKHDGPDSLFELERIHGKIPDTLAVVTPSGGSHYYFHAPSGLDVGNSASRIASGIDVRGTGGYVVLPPSPGYLWDVGPETPVEAPRWVVQEPPRARVEAVEAFVDGTRNSSLASMAGAMRRKGFSEQSILTALLEENQIKSKPPLHEREVEQIAKSIGRYDPEPVELVVEEKGIQRVDIFATPRLSDNHSHIQSGYPEIDAPMGGLGRGRLITIASRPGVGKTTLALNFASNVVRSGGRVALFSLEMASEELLERFICREAGVQGSRLRGLRLDGAAVERMGRAIFGMSKWSLFLDDTPTITPQQISERSKTVKETHGLDLLIIDYLQLISPPKADNRVHEVSVITRNLKLLARELQIPVVAMSQLSRMAEQRDGEPVLSDLRESGSIEQDSDQVILMWDEHRNFADDHYYVNVRIAKNRHGGLNDFRLDFIPAESRFSSVS